jgi:hypothetical protein
MVRQEILERKTRSLLLCQDVITLLLHSVSCPGMFDRDRSGTIDINEFQLLYNYINQWLATFRTYDRDGSGHIEETELTQGTAVLCSC